MNKTPLNRGTVAIPLSVLSHEKVTSHFTSFQWWFLRAVNKPPLERGKDAVPLLSSALLCLSTVEYERRMKNITIIFTKFT